MLLRGYHRAMCILSTHYRGCHAAPGLVLGLDREVPAGAAPSALMPLTRRR